MLAQSKFYDATPNLPTWVPLGLGTKLRIAITAHTTSSDGLGMCLLYNHFWLSQGSKCVYLASQCISYIHI